MRTRIEAFTNLFVAVLAAAVLSILVGCEGPTALAGADPEASLAEPAPDAGGTASDVKATPCHDLAPGAELPEGLGPNVACTAACTNVAGGWTCIKAGGVTTYCDTCR